MRDADQKPTLHVEAGLESLGTLGYRADAKPVCRVMNR
jgi:hypothetical protein